MRTSGIRPISVDDFSLNYRRPRAGVAVASHGGNFYAVPQSHMSDWSMDAYQASAGPSNVETADDPTRSVGFRSVGVDASRLGSPNGPLGWDVPAVHAPEQRQGTLESALRPGPITTAAELAAIQAAVEPILNVHGLSGYTASHSDILDVEGLADEVVNAALVALGREPMGVSVRQVEGVEVQRGNFFKYGPDGEPCYPDVPGMEHRIPKCPPEDDPGNPGGNSGCDRDLCLSDDRFVKALDRLQSHRNFDLLFAISGGDDTLVDRLQDSVDISPTSNLYTCFCSDANYAFWNGEDTIRIYDAFLNLDVGMDILGLAFGYRDLRASVLLHEHVHRVQTVFNMNVPRITFQPLGSSARECKGTEYWATWYQTVYLGANVCWANAAASIYARSPGRTAGDCLRNGVPDDFSSGARAMGAAGDILGCLFLSPVVTVWDVIKLAGDLVSNPEDVAGDLHQLSADLQMNVIGILLLPFLI